jgi:hypothetical protein
MGAGSGSYANDDRNIGGAASNMVRYLEHYSRSSEKLLEKIPRSSNSLVNFLIVEIFLFPAPDVDGRL